MRSAEIKRFSDQSSVKFRRLAGDRVQVTARFVYRRARYEVDGVIDMEKRRIEPFRHRLSLGGQRVLDSAMSIGQNVVRTDISFGNATQGARRLLLRTEPLQRGALVTGSADGAEMVPVVSSGCSCRSSASRKHPILVWNDDGSARPISVRLKSSRAAGDAEGLAEVAETTIARINDGGLGGIISCIELALCLLLCGLEYIWCVIVAGGGPAPDIFIELCSVVGGGCVTVCTIQNTFPG